jgi:hypothetical protein
MTQTKSAGHKVEDPHWRVCTNPDMLHCSKCDGDIEQLRTQRDELLEAAKLAGRALETADEHISNNARTLLDKAIKKAEGQS